MPHPDAELLARAKRGEEAAFVELYERYRLSVHTYIYYRTNDRNLSEELTSEVFTRLVRKIQTLTVDKSPLLAWLYTVAHNLIVDSYRHSQTNVWLPLDEGVEAGDTADPTVEVDRRLRKSQLIEALNCLTEAQRQVIVLKFMEGRSNAEIGQLLGKDEGSVKSLQHRGLGALRRALAGESETQ